MMSGVDSCYNAAAGVFCICNLLWDPARNGDALIEEFLRLHYGPAAVPIRRFLDRVHAAAQKSGKHHDCFGTASDYGLTAELGRQGLSDFQEAMELAPDEVIRARVEKASIAAWRLVIEEVATAFTEGKTLSESQKDRICAPVEKLMALCRKHGVKMVAERMRTEDAEKALAGLLDGK